MANPNIKLRSLGGLGLAALTVAAPTVAEAAPLPELTDAPILVIGASYAEGKLPLDDMMQGPFGGSSVGFGSYMDLGDALSRQGKFVVNEAQAGATATDRTMCLAAICLPVGWLGYEGQLTEALARVATPIPRTPPNSSATTPSTSTLGWSTTACTPALPGSPSSSRSPATKRRSQTSSMTSLMPPHKPRPLGWCPCSPSTATSISRFRRPRAWANMSTLAEGLDPTPRSAKRAAKRIINAITAYEDGA